MGVLQKGESNYPFWGASLSLITGLDPLSLQTTSEATYSTMLSGITNLTNRIRYYGFYCWLIDFYFKNEEKVNSTEQNRFIRKAELIIAIIMQSERKDISQITGSNFASVMIANRTNSYFDIAKGADLENAPDIYWKYESGAFGQYYFGAMRALALVLAASNDKDDIFTLTKQSPNQRVCGEDLAESFNKSLPVNIKNIFYSIIKSGRLKAEDIPMLIKYFAIDKVDIDSQEWTLYVEMLMQRDNPGEENEDFFTYHRRETIIDLINTANDNKGKYDWHQMLLKAYNLKMGSENHPVSETSKSWYAYLFNDYFQYAFGAIFWAILQYLHSFKQDQYLPKFIDDLTDLITAEICQEIAGIEQEVTINNLVSLLPETITEENLYHNFHTKASSDPLVAAKDGFLLLFRLYKENKNTISDLQEFMIRKQMLREGNMIDGLISITNAGDSTIRDFVEQFLSKKIIYRHQMVAMRKMGNGTKSTHKFIIEDQYIRFIETFPPRSTSPRMVALLNLLSDLSFIDNDSNITPLHSKLLPIYEY